MMKVEWIFTGRNDECCVLVNVIRILSGIGPKNAFSIDLLGPRTRGKRFNLSMCKRIMCLRFIAKTLA